MLMSFRQHQRQRAPTVSAKNAGNFWAGRTRKKKKKEKKETHNVVGPNEANEKFQL